MITKKLFLASSSELHEDRRAFEIFINRKNKDWVARGVFLELVIWEDFLDAVSNTRLQDEYNKAIRGCDVFVMLFWTKVGRYTEEEFETAFGQFKATSKPFIFTYFKDTAEISIGSANKKDLMSLWAFQEKLSDLGHFYTVYKTADELKFKFNQQLDKLAANGFVEFNPKSRQGAPPTSQTVHGPQTNITGGTVNGPILSGQFAGPVDVGNHRVDTGGGAYVGGSVNTGAGKFVGRDDYSSTIAPPEVSLEDFRERVAELGQLLEQADLKGDVAEIVQADFKTIERQTATASPKGVVVKSKLSSVMEALKQAADVAVDMNRIVSLGNNLAKMARVLFP